MSAAQHIPPTLLEIEDSDGLNAILKLNQNLKEFQIDLASKLAAIDTCQGAKAEQQQLFDLVEEVERALQGINKVVKVVVAKKR